MFQAFFTKSSALKLFTWIYLIPFLTGCVALRFNFEYGIFFWAVPSIFGLGVWFITVALFLHKQTQPELRLSKVSFITCLITCAILLGLLFLDTYHLINIGAFGPFVTFVTFVSGMYCSYFFSKSLTLVELRKSTGLLTFLGTMILLGMFLGILLIQPRIQKIAQLQYQ